MNDFEKHITRFWVQEPPQRWSFLRAAEEDAVISQEHKDQIHFLNSEGTAFINNYLHVSCMDKGLPEKPFKDYFANIETFSGTGDTEMVKKWLYNRGIPFSKYVFIDADRNGQSVMLTWKMVIKYCKDIFFAEDLVVFDSSLQWGLFYYHEENFYFGNQVIFDRKEREQNTILLNEIIKKMSSASDKIRTSASMI